VIIKDPEGTLKQAQEWASSRGSEALLADAQVVLGRDHLESAVLHAVRAHANRTNVARSLSMETLRYLALQRQVSDAIRVAGIRRGTEEVAIVTFGGDHIEDLIKAFEWSRDDDVLGVRGKTLEVLGITKAEASTVPADRQAELALERLALLDVLK
jgi:KEOPS complex subunit Cgi121